MSEATDKRAIVMEADFAYPVATVWQAMTNSEWLAVWFFPNDIQPTVGHKFTIWGRPIERWDGEFKCEVLALEPQRTMSFRWYGGHEELKGFGRYMDTKVTWTISPLGDGGTHFRFLHEGFPADAAANEMFEVMAKGSQSVLRTLAKRLPDLVAHGA